MKILYFMHVSWGWIKQRPHFLAEELSKYYNVEVIVKKDYKKRVVCNESGISIRKIFRLPFERIPVIYKISSFICKIQLTALVKQSDIIWLMSPLQWDCIKLPSDKLLIYDCMDDMLEFENSDERKKKISHKEKLLFNSASIVISSSENLKEKLIERYGKRDVYVINNALKEISANIVNKYHNLDVDSFFKGTGQIKLVYIGTIAKWFDFNLIHRLLETFNEVDFYLFGPTEVDIPNWNHLYYCQSVEHDLVFPIMNKADILIMPFVVNELIKSVNPVKLYEYVSSGKPCIAPSYLESQKFQDYVYLYESLDDCIEIFSYLLSNNMNAKKSHEECVSFANKNTWSARGLQIVNIINDFEFK